MFCQHLLGHSYQIHSKPVLSLNAQSGFENMVGVHNSCARLKCGTKISTGVCGTNQVIKDLGIHINFYNQLSSFIIPPRTDPEIQQINGYFTPNHTKEICIKQVEELKEKFT